MSCLHGRFRVRLNGSHEPPETLWDMLLVQHMCVFFLWRRLIPSSNFWKAPWFLPLDWVKNSWWSWGLPKKVSYTVDFQSLLPFRNNTKQHCAEIHSWCYMELWIYNYHYLLIFTWWHLKFLGVGWGHGFTDNTIIPHGIILNNITFVCTNYDIEKAIFS